MTVKPNQDRDWFTAILNMPTQTHLHAHLNLSCVKCDVVEKNMLRVGIVIFCQKCFEEEFKTDDPVIKEREKYGEWVAKCQEKLNA